MIPGITKFLENTAKNIPDRLRKRDTLAVLALAAVAGGVFAYFSNRSAKPSELPTSQAEPIQASQIVPPPAHPAPAAAPIAQADVVNPHLEPIQDRAPISQSQANDNSSDYANFEELVFAVNTAAKEMGGLIVESSDYPLQPILENHPQSIPDHKKAAPQPVQPEFIQPLLPIADPKEIAIQRMLQTQEEAVSQRSSSPFHATLSEAMPDLNAPADDFQLIKSKDTNHKYNAVGYDTQFDETLAKGALIGLFTGQGGARVATIAHEHFVKEFENQLLQSNGNVDQAFRSLFNQIQNTTSNLPECREMSASGVVCYLQDSTIYTATLGNVEANIFRKFKNRKSETVTKAIPLSPIKTCALIETSGASSKKKKSPSVHEMSRFVGNTPSKNLLVADPEHAHQPEIGINRVKQGDVIVIAPQKLGGLVPLSQQIKLIDAQPSSFQRVNLAKDLGKKAIENFVTKKEETKYKKGEKEGESISVVALKAIPSSIQ